MQEQTAPPKTSFLSTISSGLNYLVNELEKGFVKTSEEINKTWAEATDKRFRNIFKFADEERLVGEFWGQCITAGKSTSCTCYVSSNNFCFVVDIPSGKANIVIPLRDIVSVQAAVALRGTGVPTIQPVTDPRVRADAIQVFTRDLKLHQFYAFLHFDKAYNALIHAWQAIQAPLQNMYTPQTYTPVTLEKPPQPTQTIPSSTYNPSVAASYIPSSPPTMQPPVQQPHPLFPTKPM